MGRAGNVQVCKSLLQWTREAGRESPLLHTAGEEGLSPLHLAAKHHHGTTVCPPLGAPQRLPSGPRPRGGPGARRRAKTEGLHSLPPRTACPSKVKRREKRFRCFWLRSGGRLAQVVELLKHGADPQHKCEVRPTPGAPGTRCSEAAPGHWECIRAAVGCADVRGVGRRVPRPWITHEKAPMSTPSSALRRSRGGTTARHEARSCRVRPHPACRKRARCPFQAAQPVCISISGSTAKQRPSPSQSTTDRVSRKAHRAAYPAGAARARRPHPSEARPLRAAP